MWDFEILLVQVKRNSYGNYKTLSKPLKELKEWIRETTICYLSSLANFFSLLSKKIINYFLVHKYQFTVMFSLFIYLVVFARKISMLLFIRFHQNLFGFTILLIGNRPKMSFIQNWQEKKTRLKITVKSILVIKT